MCLGGGDGGAGQARQQQQDQQRQIEDATTRINQAFSGFTPKFYQGRAQDYENYAEPQLMGQYHSTYQNLLGKLANQGLLNSSAAIGQRGALQNELNTQQQGIANQALSQSQQLQQQVAQEQQTLIGQANAATNPSSVAQGALGVASSFSAPSAFAPVGQLFNNFANTYLGSQLNQTYNPSLSSYYLGGNKPSVGTGLGSTAYYG